MQTNLTQNMSSGTQARGFYFLTFSTKTAKLSLKNLTLHNMYPFSGKLFTFIESGVSLQFLSTLKN